MMAVYSLESHADCSMQNLGSFLTREASGATAVPGPALNLLLQSLVYKLVSMILESSLHINAQTLQCDDLEEQRNT